MITKSGSVFIFVNKLQCWRTKTLEWLVCCWVWIESNPINIESNSEYYVSDCKWILIPILRSDTIIGRLLQFLVAVIVLTCFVFFVLFFLKYHLPQLSNKNFTTYQQLLVSLLLNAISLDLLNRETQESVNVFRSCSRWWKQDIKTKHWPIKSIKSLVQDGAWGSAQLNLSGQLKSAELNLWILPNYC